MYVKSVRDNRNSMARINCAEKLNNQCGAQYSYCARGREGAKTTINWRAPRSVTLFKAHDFLAKARVSGGAEGRAGACAPFSCNPAITCRA